MDWSSHAARLAGETTSPRSRWRDVVECVPRHVFVPRWWQRGVPLPGPYGTAEWTGISGPA
ncbi:MAG TPA: protein-L-isoaspartate(D-aspartate) O-methyltransferase, partial [Thermobifida alba]|nr:protein-L-isoaspartate(D-aspartate) O-methyltransferase [Thermobifida alba]